MVLMQDSELEAIKRLSKDQVLHLVIFLMFEKRISLAELTLAIRTKESEIAEAVQAHLNRTIR